MSLRNPTSVSHDLCGAALAFTGCVIFLQAFHNVNSELFLPGSGIGEGGRVLRPIACTNTCKPS